LSIPTAHRKALQALAALPNAAYDSLRTALTEGAPTAEPQRMIEGLPGSITAEVPEASELLGAVLSLRALAERLEATADDVAKGIGADALRKTLVDDQSRLVLERRLGELLGLDPVVITAKAYDLAREHPAVFSSVRILTDIRSIFAPGPGEPKVTGSVLLHVLRIELVDGDDQYTVLNTAELLKLRAAVDRALEKDRQLRVSLKDTSLAPVDPPFEGA
jgi:hypothetical protein